MHFMLRSRIHEARVTEADISYVGSISVDEALMERVCLWPYEKVLVVSLTSGTRLETYVIPAPRDSGTIGMNGAAGHLIRAGEKISIMGFELAGDDLAADEVAANDRAAGSSGAQAILVDDDNRFVRFV
jgi:aspartate 1-decarboxylase